ncbi:MAG: DNA polymerase III subunit delta [Bacteroidetes bacterium]|nr:DNA polymerase III subunit delta [Bacteroidota bacterium]
MAAISYDSIAADIKARKFASVYFFCGEEDYFIDGLTDLIEQHALTDMEKAFNQTIIYGKDATVRSIVESAGRLPMMAERQVVIVREAQDLNLKKGEDNDLLHAYFKKPVRSTLLVFAWKHGKPDGRKAFIKEVQKSGVYFESKTLYDNQVAPWVRNWLKDRKYKIEEQANELLVEFTGNDLSKVANELEKLILNKQSGATITADDVEKGVGVSKEFNVFELSNALGQKNRTKVFQIANYFVANPKNGPFVLILGTLQGFFTKVYLAAQQKHVEDRELAAKLKVNPFFVKDYKNAARNYSEKKLEQIFHLLAEYDLRFKGVNSTNNINEGQLLKEMVIRILS